MIRVTSEAPELRIDNVLLHEWKKVFEEIGTILITQLPERELLDLASDAFLTRNSTRNKLR
jgi:hypothetical protein